MPGQSALNLSTSYANTIPTQSLPNSGGSGGTSAPNSANSLTDEGGVALTVNYSAGTGASQADVYFRDAQAITNGTSSPVTVTYTLSALPQPGGASATVAMARVRKLVVQNTSISTTATDPTSNLPGAVLTVAPASTNGWSNGLGAGGAVPVVPGGAMVLVQPDAPGVPVAAGSDDSFVVSVPANTIAAWQVVIEGCSQ